MVKVKKKENDKENKKRKMSEVVQRRQSGVNQHNLRRSKSVRESLRIIGTKFLHHQKHDVRKSPSLSNITDEDNNYDLIFDDAEGIHTILKTPMEQNPTGIGQKPKHTNIFKNFDFLHPKHKSSENVTNIPEVVAPKAAALLEIPLKENQYQNGKNHTTAYELYKAKRVSKLSESEDKIEEEDDIDDLKHFRHDGTQTLNRNTLRLSMNTKRRNTMWTSFSSTSSTYKCPSYNLEIIKDVKSKPQNMLGRIKIYAITRV